MAKPAPSIFEITYKKHDRDGDGKISKEEFRMMCFDLGHYFSDDELEIAFALVDANGSGTIDKDEFLNFWRNDDRFTKLQLNDEQTAKLKQLGDYFRFFDKDKNGTLDKKEFDAMCAHMVKGKYDLKRLNFSWESLDRDGDGKITFNEYITKMIDLGGLDSGDTRPVHG